MKPDRNAQSAPAARDAASGGIAQLARPRGTPTRAEAVALARDPDAWIARIRKLRDDGREDEAIAELREFDALVPDAKQRMPSELRQLLDREK